MPNRFDVQVTWDAEAEIWVADSDNIPGLAAEAPDPDSLVKKLSVLIPELIELNQVPLDPASSGIEIWFSPINSPKFPVDSNTKSRTFANVVLKQQAGITDQRFD